MTDEAEVVLATDELRPAFIADDLGGLHHPHPATTMERGQASCGSFTASIVEGDLRITTSGGNAPLAAGDDRLDAVRAACACAWTYGVRRLDPNAVRRSLSAVLR